MRRSHLRWRLPRFGARARPPPKIRSIEEPGAEKYRTRSAVFCRGKIGTPLYLAHGTADWRAGYHHSQDLYGAMAALNKDVKLSLYPGMDQGDPMRAFLSDYVYWLKGGCRMKTQKTKLIALTLALSMLAAAACSSVEPPPQTTAPQTLPPTAPATTEPVATSEPPTEPPETEPPEPVMLERFEEFYARNSDLVGWISVPGTIIDYPVVYCKDNQFYLDYDIDLNKNPDGAIFLAKEGGILENNRSLSLFGHHRKNGLMFSDLHKFKSIDFYRENPVFSFDSLYEEAEYKIFSVFYMAGNQTDGQFYYYPRADFENDTDFLSHVKQLTVRSIYSLPVDIRPEDQVVILTCCTYETDDLRIAVAGRKIRPYENPEVETDLAEENPEPLYPQKWYDKFGGQPPKVSW